jgi:hypothetical protein
MFILISSIAELRDSRKVTLCLGVTFFPLVNKFKQNEYLANHMTQNTWSLIL